MTNGDTITTELVIKAQREDLTLAELMNQVEDLQNRYESALVPDTRECWDTVLESFKTFPADIGSTNEYGGFGLIQWTITTRIDGTPIAVRKALCGSDIAHDGSNHAIKTWDYVQGNRGGLFGPHRRKVAAEYFLEKSTYAAIRVFDILPERTGIHGEISTPHGRFLQPADYGSFSKPSVDPMWAKVETAKTLVSILEGLIRAEQKENLKQAEAKIREAKAPPANLTKTELDRWREEINRDYFCELLQQKGMYDERVWEVRADPFNKAIKYPDAVWREALAKTQEELENKTEETIYFKQLLEITAGARPEPFATL